MDLRKSYHAVKKKLSKFNSKKFFFNDKFMCNYFNTCSQLYVSDALLFENDWTF